MAAHYGYTWTYVGFGIGGMVFVLNYATVCGLGRTEEEKKLREDQLKEGQSDEEVLMVNTSNAKFCDNDELQEGINDVSIRKRRNDLI